jgi:two-component sensor histidine kinase
MSDARFDWKPYALAVLLVGAAAALRFGLSLLDPNVLYFAVFFPAILLAALWGGPGPAILATSLSLFVVWFAFMPPHFQIGIKDRANVFNLAVFLFSAGLLIWIAERYRRALTQLTAAEETRRLLVEEMRHRNRNSLTVANTLIRRTLAHDPATADNLSARLRVILDTDNVFEGNTPKGEMLHRVLLAELQPYGTERYGLFGDPLILAPSQARNLALVVHELATNAMKYGALSAPDGFLAISWHIDGDELELTWQEKMSREGRQQPTTKGFGTQLIDAMIRDLKGQVYRTFDDAGFTCRIVVPLPEITQRRQSSTASQA